MRPLVAALLAAVLVTGCVRIAREPDLQFPLPPKGLQFQCADTDQGSYCCLPEDRADALLRWVQKLSEFYKARERVLNPDEDPTPPKETQ